MRTVYVRGRDELAAAILATPLDVDTVIILERKDGGPIDEGACRTLAEAKRQIRCALSYCRK